MPLEHTRSIRIRQKKECSWGKTINQLIKDNKKSRLHKKLYTGLATDAWLRWFLVVNRINHSWSNVNFSAKSPILSMLKGRQLHLYSHCTRVASLVLEKSHRRLDKVKTKVLEFIAIVKTTNVLSQSVWKNVQSKMLISQSANAGYNSENLPFCVRLCLCLTIQFSIPLLINHKILSWGKNEVTPSHESSLLCSVTLKFYSPYPKL